MSPIPSNWMWFVSTNKSGNRIVTKTATDDFKSTEKKVKLKDVLNSEAKQDFTQAAIEGNSMITIGGNTYILHRER